MNCFGELQFFSGKLLPVGHCDICGRPVSAGLRIDLEDDLVLVCQACLDAAKAAPDGRHRPRLGDS